MPVMDGLTATRKIRTQARFKDVPIIAMTAHAMVEERERCLEAGMNDHVTKPVDPEVLYATLSRWFKRRPEAGESTAAAAKPAATAAPSQDQVPVIQGLDTASALRRVSGNKKLYVKLLRQFIEGQADAAVRIRAALGAGDRPLAERIAHTVKGVSGNIGADTVQAAADRVELMVSKGEAAPELIAALEKALDSLVKRLRDSLGTESVTASAPVAALDKAASAEAARRVAALLGDSDGDAIDFALDHADRLRPLFAPAGYAAFEKAVNSFDFEAALAQLRKAAGDHQLTIEG